jgi:aryl-alcohol dehydrogenase-like predicted oxidoreductase
MSAIRVTRRTLGNNFDISAILNGLWQTSGGHGKIDETKAVATMKELAEAGFTSFDGADHYGPAEVLMAKLRKTYSGPLQLFTKWVPQPGFKSRDDVEKAINRSLTRMETTCLDMVQFHWWDYEDDNYLTALKHLMDLQKKGKIRLLGLTNFDTEHLKIIVENGIPIVSNQVSFSVIDRRPEVKMIPFCQTHNIQLLTYGTVLGCFLSERFLGVTEQEARKMINTWSLQKYYRFIAQWSHQSWSLFQELLHVLKQIGDKHKVSIANVACRYILDKPCVAGVIIGIRPGLSDHTNDNLKVFQFTLDDDDRKLIEEVVAKGLPLHGDCGDEYRT